MKLLLRAAAGLVLAFCGALTAASQVDLVTIKGLREFPEATEPGVIRYACADTADALRRFFAEHELPFRDALVRPRPGHKACHIYYEPTLRGFRASTEDRPIKALYGAVDPMRFIVGRGPTGESLDVIRTVLAALPQPIHLELRVNERFDETYWPAALERRFGDISHDINVLPTPGAGTHPWAQDYIKSGSVDGKLKILVPRRIFEGREEDGELHRPMLEGLQGEALVRSKLSWEGGDMLFVKDPRDATRVVMVYGNAAREYWGEDLPIEDYGYVLAVEFGADDALPMLGSAAHVDFLVSFPPPVGAGKPVALVSRIVRENSTIARAAIAALEELYQPKPPPAITQLRSLLQDLDSGAAPDSTPILQHIEVLRAQLGRLEAPVPDALARQMDAYVAVHCPLDSDACFDVEGGREMIRADPELLRRTADFGVVMDYYTRLGPRLLSVIQSQLPDAAAWHADLVNAKAKQLEKMGFRVVRVPQLYVTEEMFRWQGVSYANLLAVGNKLFVPTFDLGKAEQDLLKDFRKRLGPDYEVVEVPARMSLLNNGGVHCVFGIVREP